MGIISKQGKREANVQLDNHESVKRTLGALTCAE